MSGIPNVVFDGTDQVGGGIAGGNMYPSYQPIVASHLGVDSPLIMEATYTLAGLDGTLGVTIEVDAAVTTSDNTVFFVVYENFPNGNINQARDTMANEPFTLTAPGESTFIMRSFTLDSNWALENIGVAIFVQSEDTGREVLQATVAIADYSGLINVDAEPNGLDAPWTLTGPSGYELVRTNDVVSLPVFAAGDYTITWGAVEGWTGPVPTQETLTLVEDGEIFFSGVYTDGPFSGLAAGDLGTYGSDAQGAAFDDCDNDGDLDIAVAYMAEPDLLLINQGGNVFAAAADPLLAAADSTNAMIWGDVDNDGDNDLYAARQGEANAVLRYDGPSGFTDITYGDAGDEGPTSCGVWVDFDTDGKLDLYLVNDGAANKLLINVGDVGGNWFFWPQTGTEVEDPGPGRAVAWADYDNDGDQDFYLTNAYSSNKLIMNAGVQGFWDITGTGVLADVGNGAGCAWGDYDNDGDLDLYFTNDGGFDRLLRNNNGSWSQIIGGALNDSGHGRGCAWGDLDNDGDLDLFIARHGEYDRFLRNDGGVFVNVPLGIDETAGLANGVALGDTDGDGDLDVYVANEGGSNVLLVNDLDNGNHWLHLRLTGDDCNKTAIGARVRLVTAAGSQIREINGGSGFRSLDSPLVEFGLGAATVADSVIVRWPCGNEEIFTDVAADQVVDIIENFETAVPGGGPAPLAFKVLPAHPNPFNPRTTIAFELDRDVTVKLTIHDAAGRLVRTLVSDERRSAGGHAVDWDGRSDNGRVLSSGVYFARIAAGASRGSVKLVLAR